MGDHMDMQIEHMLHGGFFKKLLEEEIGDLRQKYDMKKAELEILYFLSKSGEHNTSKDIHYQLMMNRGHISQAVDGLCRRRLIIAMPDQKDRRFVHYAVSDSAQEIVDEIVRRREEMNKKILDGISAEEMQIFRLVSGKMKRNMEKMIESNERDRV